MAITESKKQSDLEKRLKILRQQVYGRGNKQFSSPSGVHSFQSSDRKQTESDIIYLRRDLFKILTLSSIAIGVQLVLFILSRNHILNLKLI